MSLIEAPPLTHRFTVLYTDGTQFVQPTDDRPTVARPDGTGSAFSDVDVDRVRAFFLESGAESDPDKHLYMVDLEDGHFEIDGRTFRLGPDTELADGQRRRLVYFRRIAHTKQSDARSGEVIARSTSRCYHLGYEVDGVQRTIEVGHELFRF